MLGVIQEQLPGRTRSVQALTTSADDRKLGDEVNTSEGQAISQRDLDRLEEWAIKNCVKFKKDKCKILQLGGHNQRA